MARYNINTYNQSIDYTKTIYYTGKNGIHYEYIMPKVMRTDINEEYEGAIDVKSRKSSTTKYKNGKKPGQYQPVGDKSYFTFYQLKKIDLKQKNIRNIRVEFN